jgi:hypothetical protein
MNIRKKLKSFLGISIKTKRKCLRTAGVKKKSRDTVLLNADAVFKLNNELFRWLS